MSAKLGLGLEATSPRLGLGLELGLELGHEHELEITKEYLFTYLMKFRYLLSKALGQLRHIIPTYLTGRVQCVRRGSSKSATVVLRFGLPQSSVLGPLLFILYTANFITLIEDFGSGDACFPPRWCELLVGRGRLP